MEIESLVLNSNRLAMDYLRFGNTEEAIKLLKNAEEHLNSNSKSLLNY
jgi:hypothetical protein